MNKEEWQKHLQNKRQELIKEIQTGLQQENNDNPLDEVLLGDKISNLMHDKNYWYSQASDLRKDRDYWQEQANELCKSLERQDKVIDEFRKQNKQMKKLIQKIDNLIGDWEWHYCPQGTPQKAIYDLVIEYQKQEK